MSATHPVVDQTVVVSKTAIRFDGQVYPTNNICQFGPGSEPAFTMPWSALWGAFWGGALVAMGAGLTAGLSRSSGAEFIAALAVMLSCSALVGIAVKLANPQRYGLRLSLSSGESKVFPTGDRSGVERASTIVYHILEGMEEQAEARIVVRDQRVTVTGDVAGSVITGDVGGHVTHHDSGSPSSSGQRS